MSKQKDEFDDNELRFYWRNARIVSAACDRYFAHKGLKSYDLKGNQINPVTKQLLAPYIPKKIHEGTIR